MRKKRREKYKKESWTDIIIDEVKGQFVEFLLTFLLGAGAAAGVIVFAAPGLITETVVQTEIVEIEADCSECEVEVSTCEVCEVCEDYPEPVECPDPIVCPEPGPTSVTIPCEEITPFFIQCDDPGVTEIVYP